METSCGSVTRRNKQVSTYGIVKQLDLCQVWNYWKSYSCRVAVIALKGNLGNDFLVPPIELEV